MNFVESVKNEILSKSIKDKCCKKAFLAGLIRGTGEIYLKDGLIGLDFSVFSEELANVVISQLKSVFNYEVRDFSVSEDRLNNRDKFTLGISGERATEILLSLGILAKNKFDTVVNLKFYGELTQKECCLKSYLRGLFLSIGSITVPNSNSNSSTGYHAEFCFNHSAPAYDTLSVLAKYGINSKITRRKGGYIVYIKNVEGIKDLCAFLSAPVSVLKLTDLMINRELSNNSNRQKNCDLGNATRQVEATAKQLNAISKLKNSNLYEGLKQDLKDTISARVEFSDDTLSELAIRLNVTKSCLNHRLRKILKLAEDL